MFRKKTADQLKLNQEIERVLDELKTEKPNTSTYTAASANLEKLYKMKSADKQNNLKADTVVTVVANLLGIGMILGYERAHVLTSKALGLIIKPRA